MLKFLLPSSIFCHAMLLGHPYSLLMWMTEPLPPLLPCQGFLGDYDFKSKTHQDEFNPDGSCKAAMFALLVKEELSSWPEQSTRRRIWLTIPEAVENCCYPWMQKALEEGFSKWHAEIMKTGTSEDQNPSPDQE